MAIEGYIQGETKKRPPNRNPAFEDYNTFGAMREDGYARPAPQPPQSPGMAGPQAGPQAEPWRYTNYLQSQYFDPMQQMGGGQAPAPNFMFNPASIPQFPANAPPPASAPQQGGGVPNTNPDGSVTWTFGGAPSTAAATNAVTGAQSGGQPSVYDQHRLPGLDQNVLNQYLMQMLQNPDPYGDESFQRAYAGGMRDIDDKFGLQQRYVDEEMARRGIHDSTIAGGRLHDLNIGRRSAETELFDRLAQNRANAFAANRMASTQAALGHNQFGQQFNLGLTDRNQQLFALLMSILSGNDFLGG